MRSHLLLLALLSGCIEDVGRGPDLGDCAAPPEGNYTYGQIGVGTCLASPTDLAFWESGGKTWLGMTNANHYYNFESGSVLIIDWDSVNKTAGSTNLVSDLTAQAVAPGNFVGGLAPVPSKDLLLVTERLSEDAATSAYQDDLLVYDISDPMAFAPWAEGDKLTVQDDPQPIVVDDVNNRAYVLNLTDHSISVIDLTTTPLETLNVTQGVGITTGEFEDLSISGSTANFSTAEILEEEQVIDDYWSLTWVSGTARIWVPTTAGLSRWHSGGGDWTPTGTGAEVDPTTIGLTTINDPIFLAIDDLAVMYFASEGNIYTASVSDGTATNWSLDPVPAILGAEGSNFDEYVGAPAPIDANGLSAIYYDARVTQEGPAVITGAFPSLSGAFERGTAPVIDAPSGVDSMEDPFVLFDQQTGMYRMWMSMREGSEWEIGTSTSRDGETWDAVQTVDGLPGNAAAPVVVQSRGRFELWYAQGDGTSWTHSSAWSWDGFTWYDSTGHMAAAEVFNPLAPPRLAIQAMENGGFRVHGTDGGLLTGLAYPGVDYRNVEFGFSIHVSSGFEADGADLHENFQNGISPAAFLHLGSIDTLFVHGVGTDGNSYIGHLSVNGSPPILISPDVIPASSMGAYSQPSDPVVFADDAAYKMVFSATNIEGVKQLFMATSPDGLNWTPVMTPLLNDEQSWHELDKRARSIESTSEGIRLWYAGSNGARFRIGSALWSESEQDFVAESGSGTDWVFGTGTPGQFDDADVMHPVVYNEGGKTHLIYSAFDGEIWSLGHAIRQTDGSFVRTTDFNGNPKASLRGAPLTFSHAGVDSPVLASNEEGALTFWYAGLDQVAVDSEPLRRLGYGQGVPHALYAFQRFPMPGDKLSFETHRSDNETNVIELYQQVEAFSTAANGASQMRLDSERGFLYVTAKLNNYIYVIDIRDDSTPEFADRNYMDLEALIAIESNVGSRGFRDVVVVPGTNRMYAAGQRPDAIVAFDITDLEDNASKEVYRDFSVGTLPLQPSIGTAADQGGETGLVFNERFGGGSMALTQGELLIVTQFLDNSVSIFDLNGAGIGAEIAYLPHIGENPFAVAVSPDHRFAVVGNYVGGALDNGAMSSTLAVIDIDKQSDTYLQPLTWITNR